MINDLSKWSSDHAPRTPTAHRCTIILFCLVLESKYQKDHQVGWLRFTSRWARHCSALDREVYGKMVIFLTLWKIVLLSSIPGGPVSTSSSWCPLKRSLTCSPTQFCFSLNSRMPYKAFENWDALGGHPLNVKVSSFISWKPPKHVYLRCPAPKIKVTSFMDFGVGDANW